MDTLVIIEKRKTKDVERQPLEIVERKGLGHPDSIADAIAERFSRNLSNYYLDHFGTVLHYNVDKLEVIGGEARPNFGGGKIIRPMTILFSGRATFDYRDTTIPVEEIAKESAKSWIKENLRFVDTDTVKYIFETKKGAGNLSDAFEREGKVYSNDTSFGVGYAPMSRLEKYVLLLEKYMNSSEFRHVFPFAGEDVKIMGVRMRHVFAFTVAMAFVDRFISSEEDYFKKKGQVIKDLEHFLEKNGLAPKERRTGYPTGAVVRLNEMDERGRGTNGCYLTVTGTSAEGGDDGAVGRGNRANGLITPNRPMTLEAVAGKNPINHIGKLYSLYAFKLAQDMYETLHIKNEIKIVNRIGQDITKPQAISVTIDVPASLETKNKIRGFLAERLPKILDFREDIIKGKITLP